ncbi:MAG: ABC transporter permease [Candidatus Thermoplasmatota archaeon]|nr:ABC transporter permease [Candidatus Thermoplasmatota archaeon]
MSELVQNLKEDMGHVLLAAIHDIKKHVRRKRIFLALLLSGAVPLLFGIVPVLAGVDFPEKPESYIRNTLNFATLLVVVIVAFFAGDTISGEFETRTCFSTFSTPQRRSSIFMGKHLSSLIISMGMVTIFYLVILAEVTAIYGFSGITVEFATSYLLALLYTAGAVGMAVFFSSILSSGIQSTLLTFFMLFLIMPIVSFVLMVASVEPWFLITYNGDLLLNIYGASAMEIPGFVTFTIPEYELGAGVMAAYGLILPFAGVLLASKREVK